MSSYRQRGDVAEMSRARILGGETVSGYLRESVDFRKYFKMEKKCSPVLKIN